MAMNSLLCAAVMSFLFLLVEAHGGSSEKLVIMKHNPLKGHHKKKPTPNLDSCNLYSGSWVRDDSYPLYKYSDCPLIDAEFNCQMYGRPDSDYLKYKWKPATCELPRFNGLDFLVKMRGKTVMFVGDSLGRNQWESLICMVSAAAPKSPTRILKADPLSTFTFLEYGVSISFYRTPYLVDIDMVQGKRILRLEQISDDSNTWKGVDVLSFNSGHWWSHKGELQGWDYMESGGGMYQDMDRLVAFDKGMRTWANWVDTSVDKAKTRVFFQGISPIHYNPSEWKSAPMSKNCYGETTPINGSTYPGPIPDQTKVLQNVMRGMKTPVEMLDITTLSQLRKDAHPSIYGSSQNSQQKTDPTRSSDCSHWCLPGLPDTWNQLFYTAMFF